MQLTGHVLALFLSHTHFFSLSLIRFSSNVSTLQPKAPRAFEDVSVGALPSRAGARIVGGTSHDPKQDLVRWCDTILTALRRDRASVAYFSMPVDPTTSFAPNYFEVIKNPMDLGTVATKLKSVRCTPLPLFPSIRTCASTRAACNAADPVHPPPPPRHNDDSTRMSTARPFMPTCA